MAILSTQNISISRGNKTLIRDLSFTLTAGQCLHLIGSNGSGKTSLLKVLSGLTQADQGQVFWQNELIGKSLGYSRDMAYLSHKEAIKDELTAAENLTLYLQLYALHAEATTLSKTEQLDLVDECLHRLKILHCADLASNKLSFGQRRRLAFSRLLLFPRKLWLLDEPFTGIDQNGREVIEELCINHLKQQGSIIITNHLSLENTKLAPFLQTQELEQ